MLPFPARVEMVPLGAMTRMRELRVSAMYTLEPSETTPQGSNKQAAVAGPPSPQ